MKCQECDKPAVYHLTEIVAGNPVEFHVCDSHMRNLDMLKATTRPTSPEGIGAFLWFGELAEVQRDPQTRKKVAAYLLPALCLALLDPKPEVRVVAAYRLLTLGKDAQSVLGALQDAAQDPDERVRKAAGIALEYIQSNREAPWLI